MPRTILVTGASGLLGNRVGEALAAAGHRAVGTYIGDADLVWSRRFDDLVACDLGSAADVEANLARVPFDVVVHTAALTRVDRCETHRDEAWAANVLATRHVVDLARARSAKVLYISTSSVFDGATGGYVESSTPNPLNYYSWTKLLGEEAVLSGSDALVVRATLVGAHPKRPNGTNFVEWLLGELRHDRDMTLFDDVMINPLTDVSLADLVAHLVDRDFGRTVLHAGTKDRASKATIGRALAEHFPRYRGKITVASIASRASSAPRAKEMWLAVDRLAAQHARTYDVAGELGRLTSYALAG